LTNRRRLHALHHHSRAAYQFGVITSVWDYVFGSRYRPHVDLARPTVRPR
jgi:sterol desaturase/sphingolipid hydroxylase (fatty acid hydroxylase superfamily)